MHFIHFNINSLFPKINEICCIANVANATTVIGLSKTKLHITVLSSDLEIEGYDPVRSDRSRRAEGVVCFDKNYISYNRKPNFCINAKSIFIEIFLHKSKLDTNPQIPLIKKYLTSLGHIQNFVQKNKANQGLDQTATLIDHIFTNSLDKVSQLGVIDRGLSDHDLIYCTRKISLPKSHKHNEIFVRSMKRYSVEKILESLREIVSPNYDASSDFTY